MNSFTNFKKLIVFDFAFCFIIQSYRNLFAHAYSCREALNDDPINRKLGIILQIKFTTAINSCIAVIRRHCI